MQNKIPPPIIGIITGLLMWLIARQLQWGNYFLTQQSSIFTFLSIIGVGMALAGVITFKLAKTTTNPLPPDKASALVAHGIYSINRRA